MRHKQSSMEPDWRIYKRNFNTWLMLVLFPNVNIHAYCAHTHTPLNFNTLLVKRKNRQKYTNNNMNPWKLWPKRIVISSCKEVSSYHWLLKCSLWLMATFLYTVCMLEILVLTRKKLGWRLKSESYFKISGKLIFILQIHSARRQISD